MTTIKPIDIEIREYHAIVNQSGTDTPIATVLHNTLNGEPVWTRASAGNYICTLNGAFPSGKTTVLLSNGLVLSETIRGGLLTAPNEVTLKRTTGDGLTNIPIQIKVYK